MFDTWNCNHEHLSSPRLADNKSVPIEGTIAIHGRDSKLLPANLQFLSQHIVYSTSEVLTWGSIDNVDYLVLHGVGGESAEIVLSLNRTQMPNVHVGSGSAKYTLDQNTIRLNFRHQGAYVNVCL